MCLTPNLSGGDFCSSLSCSAVVGPILCVSRNRAIYNRLSYLGYILYLTKKDWVILPYCNNHIHMGYCRSSHMYEFLFFVSFDILFTSDIEIILSIQRFRFQYLP